MNRLDLIFTHTKVYKKSEIEELEKSRLGSSFKYDKEEVDMNQSLNVFTNPDSSMLAP